MTVEIELDNMYATVRNMRQEDENELWRKLAFKEEVFGVPEPRWRHLYNRRTKKTYAGLLDELVEFCEEQGIAYAVTDTRERVPANANFALVKQIDTPNGPVDLEMRPYQRAIIEAARARDVIQAATGAGKAMPLDTPILTPTGFVQLADIHVGDKVIDGFGQLTTVIGEYPQGRKDEWLVTFNDGTTARCCEEHLWKFMSKDMRKCSNQWHVATLGQLVAKYRLKKPGHGYVLSIPVCKAVQFPKTQLPIPPYTLGALLGDGGFTGTSITFTNTEDDILDRLNEDVKEFGFFKKRKDETHLQKTFIGGHNNKFTTYIRETYGHAKSKDKFVPKEYLFAAEEDRLALLRGLIDTDGSVDNKGHIVFGTTSKQLAEDVRFLVLSLGYRATIKTSHRFSKQRNVFYDAYDVHVVGCDDKLFLSKKHHERFANVYKGKAHRYDQLMIVNIERTGNTPEMKCIAVDSDDRTFVSNDFIVTHNTFIMAALMAKFNVKPVMVFADKITLCEQLRSEFEKFLGVKVGMVGGDGANTVEDITVCSLQSATQEMVKDASMIMFDECHHIPADTCMNVCAMAKHAFYRIGVSATPWRDAGDDMLIDAALAHRRPELAITASRLIDEGYLVPPSIYFVPVKQQFTGRNYQKVYAAAVVENEERNLMIRKIAKQMFIRDKHILILVQQVKHGEILKKMITEALGGEQTSSVQVTKRNGQKVLVRVPMVEFMNGSDDATRRAAVLQAVREEKCRVLIATVIADEGLDLPILDTLVLAGGGKSSTRAFQRVGRVLRPYGDKTKAIVFDFEDFTPMLRRHARVRRKLYKTEPAWEIGKFVVSPYDNPPQE